MRLRFYDFHPVNLLLRVHLDLKIYQIILVRFFVSVSLYLLAHLFQRWLSYGSISSRISFLIAVLCLLNCVEWVSLVILRCERAVHHVLVNFVR